MTSKKLIYTGLFSALTAVGAFLRIPLPFIPITMQVFFVVFSGIFLGSKLGLLSQLIYVLIGLVGIPIFTQGGGVGYIFQPSFGYLIGFVFGAYFAGLFIEKVKKRNIFTYMMASLIAVFVIYLFGVPYLYLINGIYLAKGFTFKMAIYYGFIMTLPGDIISCIVVSVIMPAITKGIRADYFLKNS